MYYNRMALFIQVAGAIGVLDRCRPFLVDGELDSAGLLAEPWSQYERVALQAACDLAGESQGVRVSDLAAMGDRFLLAVLAGIEALRGRPLPS